MIGFRESGPDGSSRYRSMLSRGAGSVPECAGRAARVPATRSRPARCVAGRPLKTRHHRLPPPVSRLPDTRQRGFTLVEILAAFVIFALAFGAVMQALSGSIRNTAQSRGYTQAALMARSKMDTLGITEPIEAGGSSGELSEGYRYELDVREWEPPDDGGEFSDGNLQPRIQLYRVNLKVRWGEPPRVRQAEFSTLRAVTPEQ